MSVYESNIYLSFSLPINSDESSVRLLPTPFETLFYLDVAKVLTQQQNTISVDF